MGKSPSSLTLGLKKMLAWKYKRRQPTKKYVVSFTQGHNLDQLNKVADFEPAFLLKLAKYSAVAVNQCVFRHKTW